MRTQFLVAAILIMATSNAWAEEPAISTDRPSFSAAAAVVHDGGLQLESGFSADFDSSTTFTLPQFLFRANIVKNLEIRLGLPNLAISNGNVDLGTTSLGFKFASAVSEALSLGALPYFELPPSRDQLFGVATLGVRALLDVALADSLGLTVNADIAMSPKESGSREPRFMSSILLGWGFAPQWGAFAETYTIIQPSFNAAQFGFIGGVTYALTRTMQFDLSGGATVGDTLPDGTVSLGFSIMTP